MSQWRPRPDKLKAMSLSRRWLFLVVDDELWLLTCTASTVTASVFASDINQPPVWTHTRSRSQGMLEALIYAGRGWRLEKVVAYVEIMQEIRAE